METMKLSSVTEKSINIYGLNFLCIYGLHVNGCFLAVMNWGGTAELSDCEGDIYCNRINILEALERSPDSSLLPSDEEKRNDVARKLAVVIDDFISKVNS